jgi:hypothetical protein
LVTAAFTELHCTAAVVNAAVVLPPPLQGRILPLANDRDLEIEGVEES